MENLSIAFSYHPELSIRGTLHKHGESSLVEAWAATARKAYLAAGFTKEASEIITINSVSESDIQRCIDRTGYVAILYESITKGVIHK